MANLSANLKLPLGALLIEEAGTGVYLSVTRQHGNEPTVAGTYMDTGAARQLMHLIGMACDAADAAARGLAAV